MDVRKGKAVRVANGLGWGWSCARVMVLVVSEAELQGCDETDGSCTANDMAHAVSGSQEHLDI